MTKTYRIFLLLMIGLLVLLSGCKAKHDNQEKTEELAPLRVGMMSAVDAAPFYLAQQKGYFTDEGVSVELVLFTNGQHRQTALQTNQVDGVMTDLVALITQAGGDFPVKGTISTDGLFPLLSTKEIAEPQTLSAGTMEISVTNYLLEQYLDDTHTLEKVYINEIPARLEAVASGQLDIGIFPEPFASIGELRGLNKWEFAEIPEESVNIIAFTESALQEKVEELHRFHRAYQRAVQDIQSDPDTARAIPMDSFDKLPESVRDRMGLPQYQNARLPSDQFLQEIVQWTEHITGQSHDFTREQLLDDRFVQDL